MAKRIVIIQGHPHGSGQHYCHALADAYAQGAAKGGHVVKRLDVAEIDPPNMRDPGDFHTAPSETIVQAQQAVRDSTHLVFVFPIWLGTMPAMLKAFMEQLSRNGFALGDAGIGKIPKPMLTGKSARIIVTMGMPGIAYRVWYLNSGVSVLKRAILGLCGVHPVRQTTIGGIEAIGDEGRRKWLRKVEKLGRSGR